MPVAVPPIRVRFCAVIATTAGYVVAIAIGRRASRCGHYKIISFKFCWQTHVGSLQSTDCPQSIGSRPFELLARKRQNHKIKTVSFLFFWQIRYATIIPFSFHSPAVIDFPDFQTTFFLPFVCLFLASPLTALTEFGHLFSFFSHRGAKHFNSNFTKTHMLAVC